MNRVTSQVDFVHNGNEISGTLFTHYEKGTEKYNTIMFNYKEYSLHISLEEDESYWIVAPLHCKVIDKIGVNGYKQYDKYLSELYSIELNHIVVNNKVYNYFSKCIIESPKYYIVNLKLSDGTNLDGTYKFMENREKGNKKLLFKNLQAQASAYFNRNKIEPAIEQLNREITEVYQEMKNWIKELHESL